jgi:hypothetical protein
VELSYASICVIEHTEAINKASENIAEVERNSRVVSSTAHRIRESGGHIHD